MGVRTFVILTVVSLIILETAVPRCNDKATLWMTRGVVVLSPALLWLSRL